ncbi:MAG TPA: cyclodeaminase/cyclohydrolase family protein [Blastocatellia bacterium]|nr:cyclodeaminase/cyclohydrolase family protein [Blastocatellia bacterium]
MSDLNSTDLAPADQIKPNSEPENIRVVPMGLADSLGIFPDMVAAGTPTPGGGSVAAMCGVMAASLGQMVCNLTIGKPKFADREPRLKDIRDELEQSGMLLRELMAEDAASFEAVLKAYRLPKETEEQKQERAAQVQAATLFAINVPLDTAERSFEVLKHLRELADIGNPNALSDVAVGAQLAQTAIKGASYNVRVNLGSLTDKEAAGRIEEQIARLIDGARAIAEEIEARL